MTVMAFESVLCTLNKDACGDTHQCSPPLKDGLHSMKQREKRWNSDRVSCRQREKRTLELIKLVIFLALLIELVCVQGARISQDAKVSTDYSQCTSLQQRYRPEGALGIRYKKQILQGRDMRAELHESHMLESAIRKKHFLAMFGLQSQSLIEDDFQLQQLCPSAFSHYQAADQEIEDTFCLQPNPADEIGQEDLYMSSLFYKPRYMHISPVNSKNNEGAALGGITIQQQGSETKQDLPRDNSYLNLALNVKQAYDLPIAVLDAMDQEQTIEGFLFKKAKHNNVDNFDMMRFALPEKDIKLASLEMYQRNSFTFDEPDYIASLTNGMRPNQIQKLKTQSSIYRFFTQEVELTPQKITFNECQQLIPQFEILKITNKQRSKVLEIKTMIASSPEITFYLPDNKKMFPIRIKPQESIEIKVALIAETLGLFEGVIHAHINDWVYVATLNAFVIPNEYEISPFHVTDLLVNESFVMPLYITNPSPTHTMIVEEMYSTDPLLPLRWPNTTQIISSSLKAMDDSPVKCTLIPEGSRKHLTDIVFEINRTMDFFFEVHLRTSYNDVIRVPIYYHVHADILKLTPTVVDFGLSPLNFDVLKIPIYARSKVSELLAIQEILLPLNDIRLDFQMVDAILRAPSTSNMVRKGRELFLGYVLLNPTKSGIIESKIKLTLLGQRTNRTYHLDIPVVGMVHHEANVFGAHTVTNQADSKLSYPAPLVQFDVSDYLVTKPTGKRKVSELPQFRQAVLTTPLMLKNTFKVPIKLRGIVNNNPELRVTIENQQGNHYNVGVVLKPGETLKYAQVELQTNALKITQGNKYISVIVNNTLIPVAIGIFDRGLICAWSEHEQAISLEDIPLCSNGYEVNFDYVAVNDIKTKKLKITNVNPVNITIEQVAKQQLDDLHIYIEKVFDKNGNLMSVSSSDGDSMQSILGPKRTKRLINFVLPPYQTMQLVLQIIAKEPKQKFSRIDYQMKDGSSKDFSFNYKYHVISGTLTMVPQVIKFNPTFPGLPQQKQLVVRSTFDVPITVKTITSNDMRIMPILQNVVIKPNNKTEFGALSFDPSKSTSFAFQSNSQMNINNIDIASMLTQQLGHIDPATRQNIMNLVQGFTNNVATQQGGAAPTPQIAMIHLPKGVGQQHLPLNYQVQALFTPQDIENYREKQKVWDQQGFREGKAGEITSYVSIETNVLSNITIPIRAQVKRPSLTETTSTSDDVQSDSLIVEAIDFDVVQVGTAQARNLRVMNPTDDPMTFAIFLTTPENFEKIYRPQVRGDKAKAPQPFDKDYHFQTFCGPKLANRASKAQDKVPLQLDLGQDPVMVCSRVKLILDSLANQSLSEDINHLRRKLEDYFKDLFIAQAQRDIALQQLGDQRVRVGGGANTARSSLVDVVSGSQYSHSIGAGSQQDYDVIFYDKEIENITNTINQHSHARPLDSQTLKILKENHEKQKALFAEMASQQNGGWSYLPDFYYILQGTYNILKTVLLTRNPNSSIKQHANATLNLKPEKPKKKEFKLPPNHFRLQSSVLNDLIVKNDTSKLFKEIIKLTDPFIVTYTGQSFFINPKCQGQVYRVEPHSNLTVRDAIIFQPQSLFQTSLMEMKLVLKNNLTFIHSLDLRGKSGTGFLEVVKILKKAPAISGLSSDHYINALTLSGQIYGLGSSVFSTHQDDLKAHFKGGQFKQENITQQQARIFYNVYGIGREEATTKDSHLHNRELLMRANYRYGSGNAAAAGAALIINAEMSDPNALPFHIGQEDIVIPIKDQEEQEGASSGSNPQASGQNEETEYEEENEYVIINRLVERAAQNGAFLESEVYQKGSVKVQTYHKRALVIQNTGNLPLTVDQLSLDDQGCYAQNFIIENCHPFTLAPGEQHWVHIGYKTDYTLARVKKRLILKTKQEVIQEYTIEVNMPVEHMRIANELLPLSQFEEWQLYIVKFSLLAVTFTIFVFVAIDVFSHYKFANQLVPDHEEKILALEDAQLIQSSCQIPNPTLSNQRPGIRRMDHLPPVLKTQINHEQVYSLYQQAQDKLLDRAAGGSAGKTSQSQLVLLKEVANICSNRRTLVCLEAQKQALDADKEQRRAMQLRNQFFAQQARQEKERQVQMEQEATRLQRAAQEQAKRQQPQPPAPTKQEPSLPSDTSLNDSSLNMNQTQEQISNEDLKNSLDAQKAAKVPKISKKLKRDLEKKLKEQQEAEERFRLQQLEKQKREALELQLAKDLEYRRQQDEAKRQERLRKEQVDRELLERQQQQLQRERSQREREAAEAEASNKQKVGAQKAPQSAIVEDQDREKPEEYKGEKEEVKVHGGGENKVKDSLSRLEETKHDLKQQPSQAVHYKVVNRQYESYKKPQQTYVESNQDSQTTMSLRTAQSLTQKELIRQMQGQDTYKDPSFTSQQTLRQVQSLEEESSSKHENETNDSFFIQENKAKQSRPQVLMDSSGNLAATTELKGTNSFKEIHEENKDVQTPQFERKKFAKILEKVNNEATIFEESNTEELRKSPSPRNRLTKEDLQPFFESQRSLEEKKNDQKKLQNSNNASPLLGSQNPAFGVSSIFSFNPLNIFSGSAGGASSKGHTPDTNLQKSRASQGQISSAANLVGDFNNTAAHNLPTDFNKEDFESSDPDEEENEEEEEEDDQKPTTDLYSLFITANSLLARPNFVNQNTKQSKFLPPTAATQKKSKAKKAATSLNFLPLGSAPALKTEESNPQGSKYNSIFSMEEEEAAEETKQEKREPQPTTSTSLFSGSLFGNNGGMMTSNNQLKGSNLAKPMYSSYANNMNPWSNPQAAKLDPRFSANDPYSVGQLLNPQGQMAQNSALRRNQQIYQDNFPTPYPPMPSSTHGIPQQPVGYQQNYPYPPPPPPPGLGYRPVTQNQSLYAQYNSGINYGGPNIPGRMGNQNSMEAKVPLGGGSFGAQGQSSMMYEPNQSFLGAPQSYPQPQNFQHIPQNQGQYQMQHHHKQGSFSASQHFEPTPSAPWSVIQASQPGGHTPMMGPPPGFSSALYGKVPMPNPQYKAQQRQSSSFQAKEEIDADHQHKDHSVRPEDAEEPLPADSTPSDHKKGSFDQE